MTTIILHYDSKAIVKQHLIAGALWMIYGLFLVIESFYNYSFRWYEFFFLILGILFIGNYFWCKSKGYATLAGDIIKKNDLFGKSLVITEHTKLKIFAGEYKFRVHEKEVVIHYGLLNEDSKKKLRSFIEAKQIQVL